MMMSLGLYLEATPLSQWISQAGWLWPILEVFHFIGLCLLIGGLAIVDLRLMGLFSEINTESLLGFARLAGVGLAINLVTGTLFLIGDPVIYLINIAFLLKLCVLAIAIANLLYFMVRISPRLAAGHTGHNFRLETGVVAALSLISWFSVMVLGRLLPFFE